jgi:perosamine synthetase
VQKKRIIKLFDPVIDDKEESAIKKVLQSNFWASGSGVGNVLEFENRFKKFTNADHCLALNNGTSALHLALSLFDIKNKEVILPSLSFVSTANAILYNGGIPKFVDIDPTTLCIDPIKIEENITKKTAVILPVHFAGISCDLNSIISLCMKHNLKLIEDAAHAAGTNFKNKTIGSHGDAVCFSFHPVKNLAMPTGGLIALNGKNSKQHSNLIKSRRWCGIENRKGTDYDVKEIGWNFYMNEFSAAIGLEQLKKLNKLNSIRKKIASQYSKQIKIEEKMPYDIDSSYHFYWILVKNRTQFMKKMRQNGIETGIHYKPIHHMSLYNKKQFLPVTDNISTKIVSLPTHPNLTHSDISKIIDLTNKFAKT